MRAWMLPAGSDGFDKLYMEELPDPAPGPGEVLIQMQAWSINYRDFAVAAGLVPFESLNHLTVPVLVVISVYPVKSEVMKPC